MLHFLSKCNIQEEVPMLEWVQVKQEVVEMKFDLKAKKSEREIWSKKERRKKAVKMLQRLCKEGGMVYKKNFEFLDSNIGYLERKGKENHRGEIKFDANLWDSKRKSKVILSYRKRGFNGIYWKIEGDDKISYASEQVILAACLVCEYVTEGELFVKFRGEETKQDKDKIIEAVRWLHYLFPNEKFEEILEHRKSVKSLRKLGYKKWEYFDTQMVPKEYQQVKTVLLTSKTSLEDSEGNEGLVNRNTLQFLDRGYTIGKEHTLAIALLIVYLWQIWKEGFGIHKDQMQSEGKKNYEKKIESAFYWMERLRNGDLEAEIKWEQYDLPNNTKYRLIHAEPKSLILIMTEVSGLSYEKVEQILYRVVPKEEVERRTKEKRDLERKEKERIQAISQLPMSTQRYLGLDVSDGRLNKDGILLYKKGDNMTESVEKQILTFAEQYKKCYKKIEKEKTRTDKMLVQTFKKMEQFLRGEYIITSDLILEILQNKEHIKKYLAAVKVIEKQYQENRMENFSTKQYIHLLENKRLRKQYLGF